MQRKWLITSILVVAELALVGGMIVAGRNGLSWGNVFGLRLGAFDNFSAQTSTDQSFAVSGQAKLNLTSPSGAITVTVGSGSEIVVHAVKTAWGTNQAEAEAALAALKVTMTQSGSAVSINVEQPAQFQVGHADHGAVDFTIEVPATTAVSAHTGFGKVQLAGTSGDVDLASSSGHVSVHDTTGNIELKSDFGSVSLENATAGTVDAHTSSGEVVLKQVEATGAVVLQTDFGLVSFSGGSAASLDAQTSSGGVSLTGLTIGGQASAHSDFGRVTLKQVAAGGGYDASSSSGDVTIDGAAGAVKAHTDFGNVVVVNGSSVSLDLHSSSGAVSFSGSLGAGPHSLTTDFGNVRLSLPADTAADVDLSTGFGGIHSALPITLGGASDTDKSHWVGVLNGGGAQITAQTSSGSITLDALNS